MFIQTETLAIINTATISFIPVMDSSGNVNHFKAVTPSLRPLCSVTPRECEVILLMEATADDVSAIHGKVLRTPEWGVVDGSLNYRYGRVLTEKATGSASGGSELIKLLHAKVESAKDGPAENKIDVMTMFDNLAKDREFSDMTEEGRKIIRDLSLSYLGSSKRVEKVLERWDDIFVDLPF